eukprot:TRINITY_DN53953_c0_g1_i1.p1 TRINITY_DN53953_c0_g1~~TRINITY_DN53953_c0_g1_i1.p1  ORF type:complete len:669 (-),score=68.12 TRINITY_DN53953_c0_g1_i1:261-2141(-)
MLASSETLEVVRVLKRPHWHESFPPKMLLETGTARDVAEWLAKNVSPPMPMYLASSDRERMLTKMGVSAYLKARKTGMISCEEYVSALIKRIKHHRDLNAFMYMDSMPEQFDCMLQQARALDEKAAKEGIAAIAPLYGLPVPAKGTMATVDLPSSCGVGLLPGYHAKRDAAVVSLLRERHGILLGKTNVPEFAASPITCNYANGRTLNPYNYALIPGGSSGGAAVATAAYLAPIAFSEDTGGSTRLPAYMNQNFGYDPSRNHYPNEGNAGLTYLNDQVGLNARSLEDILAFDAALLGLEAEHQAMAISSPSPYTLRVGLPQWPFVDFFVPEGCANSFEMPHVRIPEDVELKYEAVKEAIRQGGAHVVAAEWATVKSTSLGRTENSLAEVLLGRLINRKPCDTGLMTLMHSFSGQVSQFVTNSLDAPVSVADIIKDSYSVGMCHTPGAFMQGSGHGDETQFRAAIAMQPEIVRVYNSYFDENNVDVILVPGLFSDAPTWEDSAAGTCPLRAWKDGEWTIVSGNLSQCQMPIMFLLKNIPIPKLAVPTGLDTHGRPSGVQLWGRAIPVEHLYDDDYAKTFDLDFLYKARVLVDLIHAKPALRRTDASLIADSLNGCSSGQKRKQANTN